MDGNIVRDEDNRGNGTWGQGSGNWQGGKEIKFGETRDSVRLSQVEKAGDASGEARKQRICDGLIGRQVLHQAFAINLDGL